MSDEPLFMALRESDPEYQQTIADARRTLPEFRLLIDLCRASGAVPCIKTMLVDGGESAPIWLAGAVSRGTGFAASVFEIPPQFPSYKVGDVVEVEESAVLDWMVNDDGVLHGGFSLRYQRSKLPPERQAWFDEYLGVSKYA
jgi:uncharacterized protein YegJ (DUF2314 family)